MEALPGSLHAVRHGNVVHMMLQVEGAFSQPNGMMCQQMLAWARSVTAGSQAADLLELYCGNANFTIPLAANFRCGPLESFLTES